MAEEYVIVPSAVILPDAPFEESKSPNPGFKRRASSASNSNSKRPRLEHADEAPRAEIAIPSRRGTVDADERKRGRRLFGGLLGALSRDPISSKQKRRTDIDRKQAEKLKAHVEEQEKSKRLGREKLDTSKRAERKIWDRQAQKTRHESEAALARFLKTTTQPVLYYKPWELQAEEEDLIKQQIEEAEHETQMGPDINMQEQQDPTPDTADMKIESDPPRSNTTEQLKDVDNSLQENAKPSLDNASDKNVEDTKEVNGDQNEQNILTIRNQISLDALKDHMDETGEDVVHGDEDAVLY